MGFELPPLQDIAFVGAGLIVPPMLSTYLLANVVPASYQTSQPVIYAVRAASVVIPAMLVRKFVNPRAGNLMLLGGAAAFVIQLIKDFKLIPGLSGIGSQPFLGFYENMPNRSSLGKYAQRGGQRQSMIENTPDRLSPQGRF